RLHFDFCTALHFWTASSDKVCNGRLPMKILYIGYERASAELAAGALHGIAQDFTVSWAQSPGSGLEWLQDNRDAAAVIVEVHTQSCASLVAAVRALGLDTPIVVT